MKLIIAGFHLTTYAWRVTVLQSKIIPSGRTTKDHYPSIPSPQASRSLMTSRAWCDSIVSCHDHKLCPPLISLVRPEVRCQILNRRCAVFAEYIVHRPVCCHLHMHTGTVPGQLTRTHALHSHDVHHVGCNECSSIGAASSMDGAIYIVGRFNHAQHHLFVKMQCAHAYHRQADRTVQAMGVEYYRIAVERQSQKQQAAGLHQARQLCRFLQVSNGIKRVTCSHMQVRSASTAIVAVLAVSRL